ncbi:sialin-like isoform X1 [Tubulanus polymorphus]|uniref:sialin-like isoform X1 n=1 Tax=Tubulanus polymorphus TaxID=672921 RepID=UPI003DA4FACF
MSAGKANVAGGYESGTIQSSISVETLSHPIGTHIGTVLTMGTGGYICAYVGWEAIFYITGTLNLAWCLLWLFLVYETPATHPRVSTDERKYIEKSLVGMIKVGSQSSKVPWKDLFLSPAVWGAICGDFACMWSFYTFLTNMPSYVNEVLKLDISKNGLYTGMSYFLMWILMNGTGFVSDLLQNKRVLSRTYIRKIMFAFGSFIPAGMVIGVGFLGCEMNSAILSMLILGVGSLGCALSVLVSIPMDIGPSYAGIIFGFSNTVATTSGILAPVVVGALTTGQSHEEWQVVFYICAGIAIFGFLMYCIIGSGEVQGWAKSRTLDANLDINRTEWRQRRGGNRSGK